MPVFYHSNDDGIVYLNNTSKFISVSSIGVTHKGIRRGVSALRPVEKAQNDSPDFFCLECMKSVPVKDLYIPCYLCGGKIPVTEILAVPQKGLFCKKCSGGEGTKLNLNKFDEGDK